VATGPERGDERAVDLGDRALQVAFVYVVQLEALTGGGAQRVVRVPTRYLVEGQVLVGGENPARDLGADHHDPLFVPTLLAGAGAQIAVILLVDAMEFEDLVLVLGEVRGVALQRLLDGPAQVATGLFDVLDFRPQPRGL